MNGNLLLVANDDGSCDLVVRYEKAGAEFALDFLSPKHIGDGYRNVKDFLKKTAKGKKIRNVKILVAGVLVATLPFVMLFSASASNRYNMGYLYTGTPSQQIGYVENTQSFLGTVSPSYFDIKNDGTLKLNKPSAALINTMQDSGIRVVPFLSNHWNQDAGIRALEQREELAAELADLIDEYGLDGINVDIENLTPAQREDYTEFVALLRDLVPEEKEVSVAVAANPRGTDVGWAGSYDYEGLAQHADYLMIMAYDEHYQGGPAGPVAGIGFVEDAVNYALSQVPPEQIVVGIPLFGRMWNDSGSFQGHSVPQKLVDEIVEKYDANIVYDEDSQSPVATFVVLPNDEKLTINGNTMKPGDYELWFENEASIQAKLSLIDDYDLKGSATWALGQEDPELWDVFQSWQQGEEWIAPQEPDNSLEGAEEWEEPGSEEEATPSPTPTPPVTRPSGSGSGSGGRGSGSSGGGGGGGSGGSFGAFLGGTSLSHQSLPTTPASVLTHTGYVTADSAVVYADTGTGSSVSTLTKGDTFIVLNKEGDSWYKIKLPDGKQGYIPASTFASHPSAVTTKPEMRILQTPDPASPVLSQVNAGTPMTVLQQYNDGYSRVSLADGTVGYILTNNITRIPRGQAINVKTATTDLRLRENPGNNYVSSGTLAQGESVVVLEELEQYTKVAYRDTVAYVTKGYLK